MGFSREHYERCLRPGDDTEPWRNEGFYQYYATKYAICQRHAPRSILEIGVRNGYSAYAFLSACPGASYVGIDFIEGRHGGTGADTFPYVRELLSQFGGSVALYHQDSQKLSALPGRFDFYHVDGDHSRPGCLHDLSICLDSAVPGTVILVDDYTFIPEVRSATDEVIATRAGKIQSAVFHESLRGEMVITVE